MDGWLQEDARREHQRGSCRVHVCVHQEHGVQAFFALASHEVRRGDFPTQAGGLSVIPSILLARLGRHTRLSDNKVGVSLVLEALNVAITAAEMVGSRLLVVDAKHDDLVSWYKKMGFKVSHSDPFRLSMKMATARALVEGYRAEHPQGSA